MKDTIFVFEGVNNISFLRVEEINTFTAKLKPSGLNPFRESMLLHLNHIPENWIMQPKNILTFDNKGEIIPVGKAIKIKCDLFLKPSFLDINPKVYEEINSLKLTGKVFDKASKDRQREAEKETAKHSGEIRKYMFSWDSQGGMGGGGVGSSYYGRYNNPIIE